MHDEGGWDECQGKEDVIVVCVTKSWEETYAYKRDEGKEQLMSHPSILKCLLILIPLRFQCRNTMRNVVDYQVHKLANRNMDVFLSFKLPFCIPSMRFASPYLCMRLKGMRDLPSSRFTSGGSALR